jgi:ABC-type antimicrobial peptide transport system permease subunit
MLRNYLKIIFRNLVRNKVLSIITILGLSVSMTFSILIFLWVSDEVSVDQFHKNKATLYRVLQTQVYEGKTTCSDATTSLLVDAWKEQMPEVAYATMMSPDVWTLKVGNKLTKMQGSVADEDFFLMFSFPLTQGDPRHCLATADQIVISEKLAATCFPNQNPMGQAIRVNNQKDYFVSGVFGNIPKNSTLQFDFILPYKEYEKLPWVKDWGAIGDKVFVELRENTDVIKFEDKIRHFLKTKLPNTKDQLSLQAFSDTYLHSDLSSGKPAGGRIDYVHLFSVVAILILIIACINFMNLATAQSVKRSKEVGIRKVMGVPRRLLIGQFIGEAILTASVALMISLLLVEISLPFFSRLTEKHLSLDYREPLLIVSLIGFALLTGVISGSYPAFFLSSLNPVKILKGRLQFRTNAFEFRKALVIFQFSLSVIFILGTIVVYHQMQYIQTKNLGLNRQNLIYQTCEGDLPKNLNAFRTELLQSSAVQSVTYSNQPALGIQFSSTWVDWPGKTKEVVFSFAGVSYDYIQTMTIELKEGRDFSPSVVTDSLNVIVNEEAVRQMGLHKPLGHVITTRRDIKRMGKIIGVVKDFHMQSLHEPIKPLYLFLDTSPGYGFVSVRTAPGKTREALASLAKVNKKYNPEIPVDYTFADSEFSRQYAAESIVETLTKGFSFLTIFISCLGLFGLAAFAAEQRTKEIGIRKVLGASVSQIAALLSKDFLKLVLLAFVIATPVAWYAMSQWLQNFAFRIELHWWMFAGAGVVALAIALLTVSFQAIKAALANPVKSLRSE